MSHAIRRHVIPVVGLTLVGSLALAPGALAVMTGNIVPATTTNANAVANFNLVAFDQNPEPPPVEQAYTQRLRELPGRFPWLYTNAQVPIGQRFELPDPPSTAHRWALTGGYSWGPYDGGQSLIPSGTPVAGGYYGSKEVFTIGAGLSWNTQYTRQYAPCVKYGESCNINRLITAQPLASGGTQIASAPAQDMSAQWAFKKIGLPLAVRPESLKPVVVAIVDSGLDYRHPNIKPENIWRNPKPGADPNFPGDLMGWNFVRKSNTPWDDYGHGTFVAGLITAINPAVKIMPLKVIDAFGVGPISAVGQAVQYAVDHGARVINLSLGSRGVSELEEAVVSYATARGAIIVAAVGNEAVDTATFGPVAVSGVVGVAATDQNDRRPAFGNWGQQVALAAPGVDIVSLRARSTDFVLVATRGKDYTAGANVVGADGWQFRASGTSFAAPLVAGAASLLLSQNPNLTREQVERMLVESADDIETPGWDQFTGAGRLNIARALKADPDYFLTAKVARVEAGREGGQTVVKVFGTADGSDFRQYEVQIGQGEAPSKWKTVSAKNRRAVESDLLANIPIKEITARGKWAIRLVVSDGSKTKEARGSLDVQ
jgi:subtilisin family serine protease